MSIRMSAIRGFCGLKVLLLTLVFLSSQSGFSLSPECENKCVIEWGKVVGIAPGGVEAFSNCNSHCQSGIWVAHRDLHPKSSAFQKGQAIEFVVRWLIKNKNALIVDVIEDGFNVIQDPALDAGRNPESILYEMWFSLRHVEFLPKQNGSRRLSSTGAESGTEVGKEGESVEKADQLPFYNVQTFPNGGSDALPIAGDLLVYSCNTRDIIRNLIDYEYDPYHPWCRGHVAVITEVNEKKERIYLAEQNLDNQSWEGRNYARSIPYVKDNDGNYVLGSIPEKHFILGWKRVIVPQQLSVPASPSRETAPRDTAQREAASRETAPRDTAERRANYRRSVSEWFKLSSRSLVGSSMSELRENTPHEFAQDKCVPEKSVEEKPVQEKPVLEKSVPENSTQEKSVQLELQARPVKTGLKYQWDKFFGKNKDSGGKFSPAREDTRDFPSHLTRRYSIPSSSSNANVNPNSNPNKILPRTNSQGLLRSRIDSTSARATDSTESLQSSVEEEQHREWF